MRKVDITKCILKKSYRDYNLLFATLILSLVGCSKSNPLVGTEWVAVEVNATDLEVYAYTVLFADETSGVMTYGDFVHESESANFTYNYIEPNVILTVRGNSISGVLNKDEILFEDLGFGGQGIKFNKAKK